MQATVSVCTVRYLELPGKADGFPTAFRSVCRPKSVMKVSLLPSLLDRVQICASTTVYTPSLPG